ncbi:hypothetical protein VTN02DRAFT_3785 [Thermoascus thermophilus]
MKLVKGSRVVVCREPGRVRGGSVTGTGFRHETTLRRPEGGSSGLENSPAGRRSISLEKDAERSRSPVRLQIERMVGVLEGCSGEGRKWRWTRASGVGARGGARRRLEQKLLATAKSWAGDPKERAVTPWGSRGSGELAERCVVVSLSPCQGDQIALVKAWRGCQRT